MVQDAEHQEVLQALLAGHRRRVPVLSGFPGVCAIRRHLQARRGDLRDEPEARPRGRAAARGQDVPRGRRSGKGSACRAGDERGQQVGQGSAAHLAGAEREVLHVTPRPGRNPQRTRA